MCVTEVTDSPSVLVDQVGAFLAILPNG